MARRKAGSLLPLELEILDAGLSLRAAGRPDFHGFGLAQTLRAQRGATTLTAHGTLYKALGRLEEFGLLSSVWEDAAAAAGRPRRRLYEVTQAGERAAEQARPVPARAARTRAGLPRVAGEPA